MGNRVNGILKKKCKGKDINLALWKGQFFILYVFEIQTGSLVTFTHRQVTVRLASRKESTELQSYIFPRDINYNKATGSTSAPMLRKRIR